MASKRRVKRQAQARQCGHKRGYATEATARTAMHLLIRATAPTAHMTPYKCPWCGLFHIGHTPASVQQSIRAKRERRGDR